MRGPETGFKLEEVKAKAETLWDMGEECMCGAHPDEKDSTVLAVASDFQRLITNDHPCHNPSVCLLQGWLAGVAFAANVETEELVKLSGFTAEGWPLPEQRLEPDPWEGRGAPCESCRGRGWLHMNVDEEEPGEDPFQREPGTRGEIQRCDCGAFETDEQAGIQHAADCDCGLTPRAEATP